MASEHEPSSRPPKEHTILFIGKLVEQKGVDVLIKALARARSVIPDVRLKIVGDGPEEHLLRELAADIQVSELITFAGKLSNTQVMKEFDDAFCVVIPSKYAENCSIVGIEAMSRGKIIIASNIGGLPDLVVDRETGFLVQPNDPIDLSEKIIYVMQADSLLPEMGTRARAKYLNSFSKQAYTRGLLSVYDKAIKGTS
jgi:glycosyltransferase involved in cell wall biosynthesis